jgi:hypothetical protein
VLIENWIDKVVATPPARPEDETDPSGKVESEGADGQPQGRVFGPDLAHRNPGLAPGGK